MIQKEQFGGKSAWVLSDGNRKARILEYGCVLQSLQVPAPDGTSVDICLGYDTLEEYLTSDDCFGAVVGRHANRIGGASFTLNGKTYPLAKNNGVNHLHGGPTGFHTRFWSSEAVGENSVRFFRVSPDGEEGYPGNLRVSATYTLSGGALHLVYEAVSDADTVLNLTNHSYFNLNGHGAGNVAGHLLQIEADKMTENDACCLPTGKISEVAGTPFDFREMTAVGTHIDDDNEQLRFGGGYDHNFILRGTGLRRIAAVQGEQSGILMEVFTDQPGVQLYTANGLTLRKGKDGASYDRRGGLCLETQHFPNATNHPEFPSVILPAGERFRSETVFSFSATR